MGGHTHCQALPLGRTELTEEQVVWLIQMLKPQWPMANYDILRCNCCHFCQEFCHKLGVDAVPDWVTSLAIRGAALAAGGSFSCCCNSDEQANDADAEIEDWHELISKTEKVMPWQEFLEEGASKKKAHGSLRTITVLDAAAEPF